MKSFKKVVSVALAAAMTLSMASVAFAIDPQPGIPHAETSATAGVQESKGTAAVTLSTGSESSSDYSASAHTYNAIKLFDLYKVMEADGTTQAKDSNGNNVYQYRFVPEFTDAMKTSLQSALNAGGFKIDMNTCAITKTDDSEIATQAGQNEKASDAAKLAAILAKFADQNKATFTNTAEEPHKFLDMKAGTAKNLEDGYWVIYEASNEADDGSVATKPILLDVRSGETGGGQRNIALKDAKVTVDKKIVSANAHSVNKDDLAIGDVVKFEVDTNFPIYQADSATTFTGAKFEILDNLSEGLTLDQTKITVTIDGERQPTPAGADTFTTTGTDANTLKIAFANAFIMAHQGEAIVVNYEAALNEKAAYNDADGNPNTVTLTYSNNPMNSSDVKTLTDHTESYTYAFDLRKLDGAYDTILAGAEFEMKKGGNVVKFRMGANGEYIVDPNGSVAKITTTSADLKIVGLDEGTYTLHEIKAPTGYSLLAQDVTVTIAAVVESGEITGACTVTVSNSTAITDTANDTEGASKTTGVTGASDVNVVVRNYRGITLPETGSIAAIATIVFGLGNMLGGAVLISRKKND